MRWIVLTTDELAQAQTLDDDENFVIAGRVVEVGLLVGKFVAPARMADDPACPVGLAEYLRALPSGEYQPAELFAPAADE